MQAAHVEHDNIAGLVIAGRPGTEGGPFDGAGESMSLSRKRRGSQETSFEPADVWEVFRRGVVAAVEHLPSISVGPCDRPRITRPGHLFNDRRTHTKGQAHTLAGD